MCVCALSYVSDWESVDFLREWLLEVCLYLCSCKVAEIARFGLQLQNLARDISLKWLEKDSWDNYVHDIISIRKETILKTAL